MDRYCATIDILKSHIRKHPELEKTIREEFYEPDGTLIDNDNWEEDSPVARFKDTQARYGYFEDLEELLVRLRVPFDRWTSAYDEGAYWAMYRPDIDPDNPVILDGDLCERTFPESQLRKLVEGIDTASPTEPEDNVLAAIGKRFLRFLQEQKPIRSLESYDTQDESKKE